ncbi:MAG: pyridoxal-phosphate dependent enzyme [Gammaproteobacteria bacterium]|nr:pyridoxal-phosphate dependent enzyme [Gammaproteobacteria bacterium]MCY4217676.1 pyridoxal-phosphate dependent enzyme [Gammaproteobacteria bacterium]MCY4275945.1 pyridoxal-phosphate dependent enzyme [Gammaproteobacteria bacterium]
MKYYESMIDTIGNTPLVQLNSVNRGIPGTILAKVEYFNPGNSMKDRMAIKMIEDAEARGDLKPGGTIVEGTSGNTGMGLALAAIAKGYRCVFTLADKQSREKIDILRAVGAEVIVCPTAVAPDDPRSYYSVAQRITEETENSYYPNQYNNLSNTAAHYETTGPEIWRDTEGKITHYVAGVGTGGSMCGVARYLKEQNPDVVTVGIDTYGSVFKKYKETGVFDEKEVYPYLTEGIGEDILPANVDFSLIDHFVKVTDKDAAIMTRRLSREEGMFVGWSCGSAVWGALEWAKKHLKDDDVMVIIMPDHGTRYLAKVYNDDWMKDHGFLENREYSTATTIISKQSGENALTTIPQEATVAEALNLMTSANISQLPVVAADEFVGSLSDTRLLSNLIDDPSIRNVAIQEVMEPPFQFVPADTTLDVLSSMISRDCQAVMVRDRQGLPRIITQHDLLESISVA